MHTGEKQQHGRFHRAIVGATCGFLGAGMMALAQLLLRPYLRRTCTPGFLPDSGIGFQTVYRMPEPASLTAQRLLSRPAEYAEHAVLPSAIVHGIFGSISGAVYANFPQRLIPQNWFALGFGAVLWLGATECVLPLLSLSRSPSRSSFQIQAFGLAEHLLYSCTVKQLCRAALSESR